MASPEQQGEAEKYLAKVWIKQNAGNIPPEVLAGLMSALGMKQESLGSKVENKQQDTVVDTPPDQAAEAKEDPRHVLLKELFDAAAQYMDAADWKDRLTKDFAEGKDGGKVLLDFGDNLAPKLDPQKTGEFSNPELWRKFCQTAHDVFQADVVYPKRGDEFDPRIHEMVFVSDVYPRGFKKDQILTVEQPFGYTGNFGRKAMVTVASGW